MAEDRHLSRSIATRIAHGETVGAVDRTPYPDSELDLALAPPEITIAPGPEYHPSRLDYGMQLSLEVTRGGRLWAAWAAGGDSDWAFALLATSDDRGATWSDPVLVVDPSNGAELRRRTLVANLWLDPAGRLWFFFDQAMSFFDGRAGVWAIRADDPDAAEVSWSAPERIWHGAALNKPTVAAGGDWLLPVSLWNRTKIHDPRLEEARHELDPLRAAHVIASTDQGRTWQRRGAVRFDAPTFDEHMIVERSDHHLWMLGRSNSGPQESFSADGGHTWTDPVPSSIRNVSARHFVRRLASGRLLLVKNGTDVRTAPEARTAMTAFLSDDDGAGWIGGLVLDPREKVSYPDGGQAADGTLFISYDRDRAGAGEILMARFTEQDVLAGALTDPASALRLTISRAGAGSRPPGLS